MDKTALEHLAALRAIGAGSAPNDQVVIVSHEFMGMPTALAAIVEADPRYRTIFWAHEVAPMRRIVEASAGHDTMFYNVLREAVAEGKCVNDVFGDAEMAFDPFTGDRFAYRRDGDDFTLYSLGGNGIDDGGVHDRRGDTNDIRFWPRPPKD